MSLAANHSGLEIFAETDSHTRWNVRHYDGYVYDTFKIWIPGRAAEVEPVCIMTELGKTAFGMEGYLWECLTAYFGSKAARVGIQCKLRNGETDWIMKSAVQAHETKPLISTNIDTLTLWIRAGHGLCEEEALMCVRYIAALCVYPELRSKPFSSLRASVHQGTVTDIPFLSCGDLIPCKAPNLSNIPAHIGKDPQISFFSAGRGYHNFFVCSTLLRPFYSTREFCAVTDKEKEVMEDTRKLGLKPFLANMFIFFVCGRKSVSWWLTFEGASRRRYEYGDNLIAVTAGCSERESRFICSMLLSSVADPLAGWTTIVDRTYRANNYRGTLLMGDYKRLNLGYFA